MNTILICNNDPPDTYTPNTTSYLLQGAEIGPSVRDFDGNHTTTAHSLILTQYTLPDEETGGQYVKRD